MVTIEAPTVVNKIPENTLTIGTHHGSFHCDEALACSMLRLLDEFKDAVVVRTRDASILAQCRVVVDVGGVYDPENLRFDHHQPEFQDHLNEKYKTRLSSAGLIYKHFGRQIVQKILQCSPQHTEIIFDKVYKNFIEHIDGIDNGVEACIGQQNYVVTTHLSARVGSLNPLWSEPQTPDNENNSFKKAVVLTGTELVQAIEYYGKAWLPARKYVEESVNSRFQVHSSGEIMKLTQMCPWKEHLFNVEDELNISGLIKYVLFQDTHGSWRVQTVPINSGSFQSRQFLPTAWKGLRDENLSQVSGIPGCIFVHASGFIGGNATEQGALEMAAKALQEAAKESSN